MVCLGRPHQFKFVKGCFAQLLLGPFLNTLSQMYLGVKHLWWNWDHSKLHLSRFCKKPLRNWKVAWDPWRHLSWKPRSSVQKRIQSFFRNLRWSFLLKYLTTFSCKLFSQNSSSYVLSTALNTALIFAWS